MAPVWFKSTQIRQALMRRQLTIYVERLASSWRYWQLDYLGKINSAQNASKIVQLLFRSLRLPLCRCGLHEVAFLQPSNSSRAWIAMCRFTCYAGRHQSCSINYNPPAAGRVEANFAFEYAEANSWLSGDRAVFLCRTKQTQASSS